MQPTELKDSEAVSLYFSQHLTPAMQNQNWNFVMNLTQVFMWPNSEMHFRNIGQSEKMTMGLYQRAVALANLGSFPQSTQLALQCRPRFASESNFAMVAEIDSLISYISKSKIPKDKEVESKSKKGFIETVTEIAVKAKQEHDRRTRIEDWVYIGAALFLIAYMLLEGWTPSEIIDWFLSGF